MSFSNCAAQPELNSICANATGLHCTLGVPCVASYAAHLDMPCSVRHDPAQTPFQSAAEVMSREHDVAAAAATQLTEQLALQQQAAKQALKQVCHLSHRQPLCPTSQNLKLKI